VSVGVADRGVAVIRRVGDVDHAVGEDRAVVEGGEVDEGHRAEGAGREPTVGGELEPEAAVKVGDAARGSVKDGGALIAALGFG